MAIPKEFTNGKLRDFRWDKGEALGFGFLFHTKGFKLWIVKYSLLVKTLGVVIAPLCQFYFFIQLV